MNKASHTPTPYHAGEHRHLDAEQTISGGVRLFMNGSCGALIYSMGCPVEETEATASHICHCVNLYPELVEALERLTREFDGYENVMAKIGRGHEDYGNHRAFARAILAKAQS